MSRVRAARSPANRFTNRTYLIALVRRARQPGVKFDTMPILEGPQDAHIEATVTKMVNGYQTHPEKCAVSTG
jgi:predicted P-loop ATPase